jgi:tetratricopeptide (TPR) repeat protein
MKTGARWWVLLGALGCATTPAAPGPASPGAPAGGADAGAPVAPAPTAGPRRLTKEESDRYMEVFNRGLALFGQGDLDGALRVLGEAKERAPDAPPAYLATGAVLSRMGKTAAAAAEYKRAVELADAELKPSILDAIRKDTTRPASVEEKELLDAAFQATEDKHPDKALPLLRRALDLNARNARTRYEIGFALIDLGRVDEAIPQLEEARRINPVFIDVLRELQYCYSERQRFAELRGVVTDRILVEGETAGLLQEMGFVFARSGEPALAVGTYEELERRFPDYFPARFSLGQLYCERRLVAKGQAQLDGFLAAGRAALAGGHDLLMERPKLEALVRDAKTLRTTCGK